MKRTHQRKRERASSPLLTPDLRRLMLAILNADRAQAISEAMYQDALGLARLLHDAGGNRKLVLTAIRSMLRATAREGMRPGSIRSWSFFNPAVEREMVARKDRIEE